MQIFVRLEGTTRALEIDSTARVADLEAKVAHLFASADLPRIVRLSLISRGGHITADVDLKATVLDLKQAIFERDEIPVDGQEFMYKGEQLEDAARFADCGITGPCSLQLILNSKNNELLQAKAQAREIEDRIRTLTGKEPDETAGTIRVERTKPSDHRIIISFHGRMLNSSNSLEDYNIQKSCTITCSRAYLG